MKWKVGESRICMILSFLYYTDLEKLGKSNNKAVQRVCASALWQIKGGKSDNLPPSLSTTPPSPSYEEAIATPGSTTYASAAKVMISYQWDHQQLVQKIKERLEHAGIRVWMDISNLSEYNWVFVSEFRSGKVA